MSSMPAPAQFAACMKTVQKVAAAAVKAFNADGFTLLQANEAAGGQVVFHLHFHVMPRWEGKSLGPAASKMEKPEVLDCQRREDPKGDGGLGRRSSQ